MTAKTKLQSALDKIEKEVNDAMIKWPPMHSAHEGYAVLLEEVDELWDEVKLNQKKRSVQKMGDEALQVAAMALRFYLEVCNETVIRR